MRSGQGLSLKWVKGTDLWFKMEPFILHMVAESLHDAKKVLHAMTHLGVKRKGITSASEGKYLIELQGNQSLSFPVLLQGKRVIAKDFLKLMLAAANAWLEKNYTFLKEFEASLIAELKE